MRVLSIESEPKVVIPFLNAGRRAGDFYVDQLPIHFGKVDRLPAEIDAIVVTADLQGRERFEDSSTGQIRLLGEALPQRLSDEILPDLGIDSARTGVFLAGDFFTYPTLHKRGGSGDVTGVWNAFGDYFAWVVGVAGNHDTFGEDQKAAPRFSGNKIFLDATRKELPGLKIAGLGGIIGNPRRLQRRVTEEYLELLELVLSSPTDVLIMHDGPDAPNEGYRGSPLIRRLIESLGPKLVVRGHCHWPVPLVQLAGGVQVLNVDARVVVLST